MNIDDYRSYKTCIELCEQLELVFSTNDYEFCIDNGSFYLGYFNTINEMVSWLEGFKQCKRMFDNDFNQYILDSEYNDGTLVSDYQESEIPNE